MELNRHSRPEVCRALREELDRRLLDAVTAGEQAGRQFDRVDQQAMAASLARRWLLDYDAQRINAGMAPLGEEELHDLAREAIDALFGADRLQPYLDDPEIREIRCNGAKSAYLVRRDGSKERIPPFVSSNEELDALVQGLTRHGASRAGGERRFDPAHPILDLQLESGHRVFAARSVGPITVLVVRNHDWMRLARLDELGDDGMFSPPLGDLLTAAVHAELNTLISGGTGVGKTTLLRAMSNEISHDKRMVVIEDSPELALDRMPDPHHDLISFCKQEANVEGVGGVGLAELVRAGLRASPDHCVVGEVRGDEVLPMLLAMSQGNEGSMSTVHARSSADAFSRLGTYAAMAPEALTFEASAALVAGALDLVVHLARRPARSKGTSPGVIASIREVVGHDGGQVISNEVMRMDSAGNVMFPEPWRYETAERLAAAGFDPAVLTEGFW